MDIQTDNRTYKMHGEVFMKLGKDLTREEVVNAPDMHKDNIIVDVASVLIAEWAFQGASPTIPGVMVLAVGTGAIGWDLQNPPAALATETQLFTELTRKTFATKTYMTSGGAVSPTPTNIIDFTTTFLEAEAVGALVEMGLFAGTGWAGVNGGRMLNCLNHPVLNKTGTSQLTIVWRITF